MKNPAVKSNKQIDIVVKYFYPVTAGIETNVLETYSVLAKSGWQVTVHASRDVYLKKNFLPLKDQIRGLKVRRYNYGLFGFWPKINWQKTQVVALHNFNIFPHLLIMLFALYLKITKRKKFALIITPHGGFTPEWRIFSPFAAAIKRAYHFTIGTILINLTADGMRAVSEWEKKQIITKGVRKKILTVIDNGLEAEAFIDLNKAVSTEFKNRVGAYGKYILQVCRIYMIKNQETVIRALAELPEDINYVITGPVHDADYKKKLEKLIKSLGLEKRVIFTGVIKGADKYYLMKKAQLMVHMALWESYCNVVHEGLSQGLVCVVANNTALPYLVKNRVNGFCIATKDVEALSEKIAYVLKNKNTPEIKAMEKRNREYGLKNSWQEVACKMDKFYQTALKNI